MARAPFLERRLHKSKLVTPLGDVGANPKEPNNGFDVTPYQGSVDISHLINDTETNFNKRDAAKGRVEQWKSG